MSTVVAILASIAGGRNRLQVTSRPRAQPLSLGGEADSRVQPSKIGPFGVAGYRHEVIEQPHVLDCRYGVRLPPDPLDVLVADLHGGGRDSEGGQG